jgi:hypothetical protein
MTVAQPAQSKPRSHVARAGVLCLLIGMVLMFLSLGTFFIYGPLFLAAFVLSIVAMAQGRVAAGVLLLLATISITSITWIGLFALRWTETTRIQKAAKDAALANVVLEDVTGRKEGDYFYIEGRVRNNGSESVGFVKVAVELLAGDGTVVDTDYTYAVAGDGLRPGSAKSFRIMAKADRQITQYRYYVVKD